MRKLNRPIAVIAAYWWALETSFFGWNTTPGSTAELFADGLALVLLAAAFAFPPRAAGWTIDTKYLLEENPNARN